jgi:hypothetical protein
VLSHHPYIHWAALLAGRQYQAFFLYFISGTENFKTGTKEEPLTSSELFAVTLQGVAVSQE